MKFCLVQTDLSTNIITHVLFLFECEQWAEISQTGQLAKLEFMELIRVTSHLSIFL